jgi:hypothetical protein
VVFPSVLQRLKSCEAFEPADNDERLDAVVSEHFGDPLDPFAPIDLVGDHPVRPELAAAHRVPLGDRLPKELKDVTERESEKAVDGPKHLVPTVDKGASYHLGNGVHPGGRRTSVHDAHAVSRQNRFRRGDPLVP